MKICCISSIEEANTAINLGAHALGLVASMPSGPGVISEDLIAKIARYAPPAITSVLLTSYRSTTDIVTQHRYCRTNAIQICDDLQSGTYEDLRQALPGISLIQVIHVSDRSSLKRAINVAPLTDALLLDSGQKINGKVELGGTGRTHDWSISEQICRSVDVPVFLAGGLNPDNVQEAIKHVHPFAVDVCSGVRTDGHLDREKLERFVKNVTFKS
jgi:phosphoribosylanthranilate isomerase